MRHILAKLNPRNWFKSPPEPQYFRYRWVHLTSGKGGVHERKFASAEDFHRHLVYLNRSHATKFKYWPIDNEN